jgi:hypothetical protein
VTTTSEQRPWSLDLPGLDRSGAEKLVAFARKEGLSAFASAVDPAHLFTAHLDINTVKSLVHLIYPDASIAHEEGPVNLVGFGEDLKDWLDRTVDCTGR